MEIPVYQPKVRAHYPMKPVSTAEQEKHLMKAREAQKQARKYQEQARKIGLIGDITQSVLNVASRLLQTQEAVEVMNAETEATKRFDDLLLTFQNPEEPIHWSEYGDKWKEVRESTKIDVMEGMKLPGSKKEFERRYERMANNFETDLQTDVYRLQTSEMRADFYRDYNYWVEKGDFNKVQEYITGADTGGLLRPGEADELLNDAKKRIAEIQYAELKQSAWEIVDKMPLEEGTEAIMNPKYFKGLKTEDRTKIKNAIKVDDDIRKQKVKEDYENLQRELEGQVSTDYVQGNLRIRDFGEGGKYFQLDDSKKSKWINMEEARRRALDKDPTKKSNPELVTSIVEDILNPEKDELETKKRIADNIGFDSEGNMRVSPQDAEKLTSWTSEHKDNPVFKQALNMFKDAKNEGFINETELAEMTNEYQIKVSSGDYTPAGLIQEAENMIAGKSHEYIADELERRLFPKAKKPEKLKKRKETVEEWIKRHPPEKKPPPPIEEGNISDFIEWKNIDATKRDVMRVSFDTGDVFSDDEGITWYMKYKGTWYTVDPITGDMTPYKREK